MIGYALSMSRMRKAAPVLVSRQGGLYLLETARIGTADCNRTRMLGEDRRAQHCLCKRLAAAILHLLYGYSDPYFVLSAAIQPPWNDRDSP